MLNQACPHTHTHIFIMLCWFPTNWLKYILAAYRNVSFAADFLVLDQHDKKNTPSVPIGC